MISRPCARRRTPWQPPQQGPFRLQQVELRSTTLEVARAAFHYRHQWCIGDLLMWDNCCSQHLAVKDYDLSQRRLRRRVTVNGSVPV